MAITYRHQSRSEEVVNAIIHGFGLLLAIVATPLLIIKANHSTNIYMIWGVCLFSFGIIAVYLSSTVYHAITNPVLKSRANVIDHISIYFLIGGTYTPIILYFIIQTKKLLLFFLAFNGLSLPLPLS